MKYFKKEATRSAERYIITAENFEKVTDHHMKYGIRTAQFLNMGFVLRVLILSKLLDWLRNLKIHHMADTPEKQ